MSIDQTTQRRDLVQQREEIERQALEIRSLQAHIQALELANLRVSSISRQSSGPYTPLGSGPPSPSAERYSPVQNYDVSRQVMYSSNPLERVAQPASGLVMPTVPPRRRVTVSDQHQIQRASVQATNPTYQTPMGQVNNSNFRGSQATFNGGVPTQHPSNRPPHGPSTASAPNLQTAPFHALAAASGVLLPENEVSEEFEGTKRLQNLIASGFRMAAGQTSKVSKLALMRL